MLVSMYEVFFLNGPRAGTTLTVTDAAVAGRTPECDIEVPDPNASRRHAQFSVQGRHLNVADAGSSNGTYLNENRLATQVSLRHGDVVRIGNTQLRVLQRNAGKNSAVFSFDDSQGDITHSLAVSIDDIAGVGEDAQALAGRLQAMISVSEALVSVAEPEVLYARILDILFEAFSTSERGYLVLLDQSGVLAPRAGKARRGGGNVDSMQVSRSLCQEALRRREVMVWKHDDSSHQFDEGMSLVALGVQHALAIPLVLKEETLGVIVLDNAGGGSFKEAELPLAAAIGRQVAVALKNARLLDDIGRQIEQRRNLERFLPAPVVEQAVAGQVELKLGGDAVEGTVFFCDVVGFTRMSEHLQPEDVVRVMNRFFDAMVPAIEATGGAIDKFMGDCIMAFWGIPYAEAKHARQAVAAACTTYHRLAGLNAQAGTDYPLMEMAVGFESGALVAGNIGSENRLEYTVLGDTVNTASRVQAVANPGQILVGPGARRAIGDGVIAVKMPPVRVKNKAEPVQTFSIRGLKRSDGETVLSIPVWCAGKRGMLIRRLATEHFVLLMPAGVQVNGAPLLSAMAELPQLLLGRAKVESQMQEQGVDGGLNRYLVSMSEPSLGGLLAGQDVTCTLSWEQMTR
jgi:adenylate cyclase